MSLSLASAVALLGTCNKDTHQVHAFRARHGSASVPRHAPARPRNAGVKIQTILAELTPCGPPSVPGQHLSDSTGPARAVLPSPCIPCVGVFAPCGELPSPGLPGVARRRRNNSNPTSNIRFLPPFRRLVSTIAARHAFPGRGGRYRADFDGCGVSSAGLRLDPCQCAAGVVERRASVHVGFKPAAQEDSVRLFGMLEVDNRDHAQPACNPATLVAIFAGNVHPSSSCGCSNRPELPYLEEALWKSAVRLSVVPIMGIDDGLRDRRQGGKASGFGGVARGRDGLRRAGGPRHRRQFAALGRGSEGAHAAARTSMQLDASF